MNNMIPNSCWCCGVLLVFALFLHISSQLATSGSTIGLLPGFEGPLPFQLETGYVGLGEREEQQVFYYFIKSENNPEKDPLLLWLTGGPGCSSLSALLYQIGVAAFEFQNDFYHQLGAIGPLAFKVEEYNESLPSLVLRPESWTKACSIIFVDLPIETGFSYGKNLPAQRSDLKLVQLAHLSFQHAHLFFRKWLIDHSKFLSNQLYVRADSYSGIPAPAIVQEMSNGNGKGAQPWINLQGYVLGNPITTQREKNHRIPFAHGMGLISDELYARNCKGEYEDIDSRNELCLRDVDSFDKSLLGINLFYILDPLCERASPKPHEALWRRSLTRKQKASLSSHLTAPELFCRNYDYFLGTQWVNDDNVRKALHIREGSIGQWQCCFTSNYEAEISSRFEYHANLSKKGYRSLIYSEDHDAGVPFISTQAWIRALNYSIVDDWRPWTIKGQVAGYTRTYGNQMTFATMKGAGHTAPGYKPEECLAMFTRWISDVPL